MWPKINFLIKLFGLNGGLPPPLTKRYTTITFTNMPELNIDILEEIIHVLLKERINSGSVTSLNLLKFMLAGREPFKVVLRYFLRVKKVAVWEGNFCFGFENEKILYLLIDFILAKPILKVCAKVSDELLIGNIAIPPEKILKKHILDTLISKRLKNVSIFRKLPDKYYSRLKEMDDLETLKLTYFPESLTGSVFPSSVKKLNLKYMGLSDIITGFKGTYCQFIEELEIDDYNFDFDAFKAEDISNFAIIISTRFPMLKRLEFYTSCDYPNVVKKWEQFPEIYKIEPNFFKAFPSHIEGYFHINLKRRAVITYPKIERCRITTYEGCNLKKSSKINDNFKFIVEIGLVREGGLF